MDINACKQYHNHHNHHHHHNHHSHRRHHHHPNQPNHQNNNCIIIEGDCSPVGVCMNNADSIMSRLSPCGAAHGAVPMHQEACTPFSVMDTTPVFNSDSNMPPGLEPNSCLLQPFNSRVIHSPCLQLDGLRYESTRGRVDPHSPLCMVPLPEYIGEPSFIRRRNERERERVRCVNDGYDRLKESLPMADKDRRLSKVETLRGAIKYIRQLKRLLEESDDDDIDDDDDDDDDDDGGVARCRNANGASRSKRYLSSARKCRSLSLSSSDPDLSLSDS